jgi:hypothetical protein
VEEKKSIVLQKDRELKELEQQLHDAEVKLKEKEALAATKVQSDL